MDILGPLCGAIYDYDEGLGTADLITSLRAGDAVIVTTMGRLAPTREGISEARRAIHAKKCQIIEATTSRRSENRDDALDMFNDAIAELAGDSRALPTKDARKYGKMAWQKKLAGRTSVADATAVWQSTKFMGMSNAQCLAQPGMKGWGERSAYREIGPRGLAKGRPRNSD